MPILLEKWPIIIKFVANDTHISRTADKIDRSWCDTATKKRREEKRIELTDFCFYDHCLVCSHSTLKVIIECGRLRSAAVPSYCKLHEIVAINLNKCSTIQMVEANETQTWNLYDFAKTMTTIDASPTVNPHTHMFETDDFWGRSLSMQQRRWTFAAFPLSSLSLMTYAYTQIWSFFICLIFIDCSCSQFPHFLYSYLWKLILIFFSVFAISLFHFVLARRSVLHRRYHLHDLHLSESLSSDTI